MVSFKRYPNRNLPVMAKLYSDSQLNVILEEFIEQAKEILVFFSPYFKLQERLKNKLKVRMEDPKLRVVVVFGKNPDNPEKSMSREDFEFLKGFPNVTIKYEKRLHAKYYANEKEGMITSLNLHSYSQANNIEVGVVFSSKGLLKSLANMSLGSIASIVSDTEKLSDEADKVFKEIYANAELVFENESQFESKFMGLQKIYTGSKILTDNSSKYFGRNSESSNARNSNSNSFGSYPINNNTHFGYCIRTGVPIDLDVARPLSYDAYLSWAQFGNPDYPEKYCHICGKLTRTSVKNPLCSSCGM